MPKTVHVLGIYLHQPEARALASCLHNYWVDRMAQLAVSETEAWGDPSLKALYAKLVAFAWPEGE